MSRRFKILNIVAIVFLICLFSGYVYMNHVTYEKQKAELEETSETVDKLKSELEKVEAQYDKFLNSIYSDEQSINRLKVQADKRFLTEKIKPCFEFDNAKTYNENRAALLKCAPENSVLFSDFLVKNDESLGGLSIESTGLKMECSNFSVCLLDAENSSYFIVLDYLPYRNADNKSSSHLYKQRLFMIVTVNSASNKITKLDCYKADKYI